MELTAAEQQPWAMRDARIESAGGSYGLRFAVTLPAEERLGSIHLLFAGGIGWRFYTHLPRD